MRTVILMAMNKHPFPSNNLSALRWLVWTAIVAATVVFWGLVAAAVIALFR